MMKIILYSVFYLVVKYSLVALNPAIDELGWWYLAIFMSGATAYALFYETRE